MDLKNGHLCSKIGMSWKKSQKVSFKSISFFYSKLQDTTPMTFLLHFRCKRLLLSKKLWFLKILNVPPLEQCAWEPLGAPGSPCHLNPWNALELLGTPWNALEPLEAPWNPFGNFLVNLKGLKHAPDNLWQHGTIRPSIPQAVQENIADRH